MNRSRVALRMIASAVPLSALRDFNRRQRRLSGTSKINRTRDISDGRSLLPTFPTENSVFHRAFEPRAKASLRDTCRVSTSVVDSRYTFPNRAVVKIFVCWGTTCSACSGSMLGERLVLTTAHCVYDLSRPAGDRWITSALVIPGQGDSVFPFIEASLDGSPDAGVAAALDKPYGYAWSTYVRTFPGYTELCADCECSASALNIDMAVIEIDRRLGARTGYFGTKNTVSTSVNVAGYPASSCWGILQYARYFPTDSVRNESFHVNGFIEGGDSGSPAFFYSPTPPIDARIEGTVACGSSDTSTLFCRMSSTKNTQISTWTSTLLSTAVDRSFLVEYVSEAKGISQSLLYQGLDFDCSLTLLNVGWKESGIIAVNYWLSTDLLLSSSDIFVGTRSFSSLNPFTAMRFYADLSVPSPAAGTYFLIAEYSSSSDSYALDFNEVVIASRTIAVNCVVSAWTEWSTCNASCGSGTQVRTRIVTVQPQFGGLACPALTEYQACNLRTCEDDDLPGGASAIIPNARGFTGFASSTDVDWFKFSAIANVPYSISLVFSHAMGDLDMSLFAGCNFSSCSLELGSSTSVDDNEFILYVSPTTQTVWIKVFGFGSAGATSFSIFVDFPVDCVVSDWSGWSGCNVSCGSGTQSRTRMILTQSRNGGSACPPLSEIQVCISSSSCAACANSARSCGVSSCQFCFAPRSCVANTCVLTNGTVRCVDEPWSCDRTAIFTPVMSCLSSVSSVSVVSAPSSGTLSLASTRAVQLVYSPKTGFSGPDSFVYQACDPNGNCATARVLVTVTTIPPSPPTFPVGAIIGIAIGGAIFFLLVIVAVVLACRRNKRNKHNEELQADTSLNVISNQFSGSKVEVGEVVVPSAPPLTDVPVVSGVPATPRPGDLAVAPDDPVAPLDPLLPVELNNPVAHPPMETPVTATTAPLNAGMIPVEKEMPSIFVEKEMPTISVEKEMPTSAPDVFESGEK